MILARLHINITKGCVPSLGSNLEHRPFKNLPITIPGSIQMDDGVWLVAYEAVYLVWGQRLNHRGAIKEDGFGKDGESTKLLLSDAPQKLLPHGAGLGGAEVDSVVADGGGAEGFVAEGVLAEEGEFLRGGLEDGGDAGFAGDVDA